MYQLMQTASYNSNGIINKLHHLMETVSFNADCII